MARSFLSDPPLRVVLATEPYPPRYSWRCAERGTYIGACSTEADRAEALALLGHRVVGDPPAPAAAPPAPPAVPLPPVSAEAIRDAGMVPISFADTRLAAGKIRVQRLASPVFPDLQKIIQQGPGRDDRTVSFAVAGQDVPADPAALVAALEALGAARQPPMEQRA